jgi:hypothetical protein
MNYKKEKVHLNDQFVVQLTTPPRQHQKFSFTKSDASKKEIVQKHRRRPIIDLRFSPWRKSSLSKPMPSTRSLLGTTN